MANKHFRAKDGKVAVWTGSDFAPFDDPLGNLSRVLFHSDLLYPAIIAEVSGTLNLPARSGNTTGVNGYNLFAHGRSGTPLVLGYVTVNGARRRIAGSYPLQRQSVGFARWLSVGATDSYVRMAETWTCEYNSSYAAISVSWRVFVLETTFESTPGSSSEWMYAGANDFRAGGGKFDARKRYLRNGNTLQNFPLVRGRSLDFAVRRPSNFPVVAVGYNVADDTFRTNYTTSPAPGQTVSVTGPAFVANYALVTT